MKLPAAFVDKVIDVLDDVIDTITRKTNEPDLARIVVEMHRTSKEMRAQLDVIGAAVDALQERIDQLEERAVRP